MLVKKGATDNF
jgi:hypothetical protein